MISTNEIKVINNPNCIDFYYHSIQSFDNYCILACLKDTSYELGRIAVPKYLSSDEILDDILIFILKYMKEVFPLKIGYFPEYKGYRGTIEYDIKSGYYYGSSKDKIPSIKYQADSPPQLLKSFRNCVDSLV